MDLQAVVRGVLSTVDAAASEKGLLVKAHVPAGLVLRADRLKVERILANLVGNAVKFTDHGSVSVEAERVGGAVLVHVTDTGRGIAPEDRDRLFDEFFQAHNHERNRRKGFGLKLLETGLAPEIGGLVSVEFRPAGLVCEIEAPLKAAAPAVSEPV